MGLQRLSFGGADRFGDGVVARSEQLAPEYREQAVRLVVDTGRPVAHVAAEIGVGEQLLGRWVAAAKARLAADNPTSHHRDNVTVTNWAIGPRGGSREGVEPRGRQGGPLVSASKQLSGSLNIVLGVRTSLKGHDAVRGEFNRSMPLASGAGTARAIALAGAGSHAARLNPAAPVG